MNKEKKNSWQICTAIMARDTEDALEKMHIAAHESDLLEIRLDAMESFHIPSIMEGTSIPLIFTYRDHDQGGISRIGHKERAHALMEASRSGAAFIDMELTMPDEQRQEIFEEKEENTEVIISHHFFTPCSIREVERAADKAYEMGADIVKVIGYASDWRDNLSYLSLIKRKSEQGMKILSFAMGPFGRPSRILAPLMGAPWTYAALSEDQKSAPGQLTAHALREIWRLIYGD